MDNRDTAPGRDVYALLAQANLLRMRGCWEEAIENCMAALRLAPDSPSAQSLLGDIYENQERYDDAIQWYRMALDLNPGSTADQTKLERLLHVQRDGSRLTPRPGAADRPASGTPPGSEAAEGVSGGRHPPQLLRSETALRVTALTAAVLVFVVVASAYVSVHRRAALSALGLSPDQEVKRPLLVVSSADGSPPAPQPAGSAHDASEMSLLDSLRASQDLTASGVIVYDVEAEPRTSKLALTFGVSPGTAGALSHAAVLRAALRLVRAASALPGAQSTSLFTARCLIPQAGGSGPATASLVFVGDVPRDAIPPAGGDDAGLSETQVESLFGSPWWSPQLPG